MKPDMPTLSLPVEMIRHHSHSSRNAALLKFGVLNLAIMLMALIGFVSHAQADYPIAKDLYVNDFAKLLTAGDTITIRTALAKLRGDAGVEAVVVTIRSIHGYRTGDQTIESFGTNLFNNWEIGDRQKNDGVLILVSVKDRKVRIELGSGYGKSYNAQMQNVISQQMLPHFRKRNYSLGILEGTNAVVQILSERASTLTLPPAPTPTSRGNLISSTSDSSNGLPLFVIVGGAIAAVFGPIWYARSRRRRCDHCRVDMIRLDGASENQYLNDGQKSDNHSESSSFSISDSGAAGSSISGFDSGSSSSSSFGGGSSSGDGASGSW